MALTHTVLETAPTGAPVRFFVAGHPISANHRTRRTRTGHFYVTPEARAWERAVADEALVFRSLCRTLRRPLRLRVTYVGGRGDLDNGFKSVLDGVKVGIAIDDAQFCPIEATREPLRKRTRGVLIEIWPAAVPAPLAVRPSAPRRRRSIAS